MPLGFSRSSYEKITCPDGSIRLVLKDPRKIPEIFAVQASEWNAKIEASIQATQEIIGGGGGADISKAARTLLDDLSVLQKSALQRYTAAYMQYTTNPCANDGLLNQNIEKINSSLDRLQEIEYKVGELKDVQRRRTSKLKVAKTLPEPTAISGQVHVIVGDVIKAIDPEASVSRASRTDFWISRFQERDPFLNEIVWKIRILHPDKRIDRCSVRVNDTALRLWDTENDYVRTIEAGGGANFVIPNSIFKQGGKVLIMSHDAVIASYDFEDIEVTKP